MKIEITGDRNMLKFVKRFGVKLIADRNVIKAVAHVDENLVYATHDNDSGMLWIMEGLNLDFVKAFIELVSDK